MDTASPKMSAVSQVKVPASPVVVKAFKKDGKLQNTVMLPCLKIQKSAVYKDEIIYKSKADDFLRGEFPNLVLFNRQNIVNSIRTTIARYNSNTTVVEKTSKELTKVIGQENYDIIFSALCSVISLELRIRAILALLTVENNKASKTYQEKASQVEKVYADGQSQTYESSRSYLESLNKIKRVKRPQFRPYVLPKNEDKKVKRVIINPKDVLKPKPELELKSEQIEITKVESLLDLREIINEDSNFSDTSHFSVLSQQSMNIPDELLNSIEARTEVVNSVPLTLLDGSVIMVCAKPMDKFHYATPDILKTLPEHQQRKLMYQQAFIDWKYCMEEDEDGYYPIHHAVMTNDLPFLKRQCVVLKNKHGTVDLMSKGSNMIPLQLSLHQDGLPCTSMLLEHGADALQQDDEGKSFFHTAAEVSHQHLRLALDYCRNNARQILSEDEDLWSPEMEKETDEKLSKILLDHICVMVDNAGYTPLMLASKQGNHLSTQLLVWASPDTVNCPMPNSGITALYAAVSTACMEAQNSLNHTKISEKFMKTIEILVVAGADPSIENYSGSSVNTLLSDFNIVDLCVLIANKLSHIKYYDSHGNKLNIKNSMLLRSSDGQVKLTEIKRTPAEPSTASIGKDVKVVGSEDKNRNVDKINEVAKLIAAEPKKSNTANVPKYVKILPKPSDIIVEPKTETTKDINTTKRKGGDLYYSVVKKQKKRPLILSKINIKKEPPKNKKIFSKNENNDNKTRAVVTNVKSVQTGVFSKSKTSKVFGKTVTVETPKTVSILPKTDPNVKVKDADDLSKSVEGENVLLKADEPNDHTDLNGDGCSDIQHKD